MEKRFPYSGESHINKHLTISALAARQKVLQKHSQIRLSIRVQHLREQNWQKAPLTHHNPYFSAEDQLLKNKFM